jgi:hypothetical protein
MPKFIPIVCFLWVFSLIATGLYMYNQGVTTTKAKMQQAVTKQVESNIHTTNDNIALVESLNEYNLRNWQRLLYPPSSPAVIKYSQVCESGRISQEVINVINGAIK